MLLICKYKSSFKKRVTSLVILLCISTSFSDPQLMGLKGMLEIGDSENSTISPLIIPLNRSQLKTLALFKYASMYSRDSFVLCFLKIAVTS